MLLLGLPMAQVSAAATMDGLRYRLTPEVRGATALVKIDVWFRGGASGRTALDSPEGRRDAARIEDVRAGEPATLEGDSTREARLGVEDADGARKVSYFPAKSSGSAPQFALDAQRVAADRQACLDWFGR